MGQGIAIALGAAGRTVTLLARTPRAVQPPLVLDDRSWDAATRDAEIVLVATPDDAIEVAARALLERGAVRATHAVLHLSGLLDRRALAPLESTGAALGSFHPLQTIVDPGTAPPRLAGAFAGLEGDTRALQAGERLAGWLGMQSVRLDGSAKPLYHAAAVVIGNYTVALAAVAERLALAAGVPPESAARIYLPLLAGVVQNLQSSSPAGALTGPIRRGDVATIRRHVASLPPDVVALYRLLGLEALALARSAGLDDAAAGPVAEALGGG